MPENKPTFIALALGSNIGNRMLALRTALDDLAAYMDIQAISPAYEAAAAGVAGQPAFLNAAVIGATKLQPLALLWNVKDIESEMGRVPTFRYGPRVIDIDLLFYGDQILETPELTVPHKRLAEREFVLRPLADIAPDLRHPQTGDSISAMLARLPATSRLAGPIK